MTLVAAGLRVLSNIRPPAVSVHCEVGKIEVKEAVERELVQDVPRQRTGECRHHFCNEQTSPSAAQKHKVSFAPNREEIEPEMAELEQENLTLASRILRRSKKSEQSDSAQIIMQLRELCVEATHREALITESIIEAKRRHVLETKWRTN